MAKALIVDDSKAMRMMLSKRLSSHGFEVVQAANGKEAVEAMQREGSTFELALVDWNMPEMTGLEFIQWVRARAGFAQVRIVMVTTETEIEQLTRALEAGADEYVMKPFTNEAIEDKLRLVGAIR